MSRKNSGGLKRPSDDRSGATLMNVTNGKIYCIEKKKSVSDMVIYIL